MLKKTLTTLAVAGALVLMGASAASADTQYTPNVDCTANPASVAPGQTSVITCDFPNDSGLNGQDVTVSVSGPGVVPGTLSSFALAADGTSSVTKTIEDLQITADFLAPNVTSATNFTVTVFANPRASTSEVFGQVTVAVVPVGSTATPTPGVPAPGLPATGGTVPAAAIWLGVGAIGIGGIAVTAAVARRRAAANR